MLPVRLPVNSRLIVVKIGGGVKSYRWHKAPYLNVTFKTQLIKVNMGPTFPQTSTMKTADSWISVYPYYNEPKLEMPKLSLEWSMI